METIPLKDISAYSIEDEFEFGVSRTDDWEVCWRWWIAKSFVDFFRPTGSFLRDCAYKVRFLVYKLREYLFLSVLLM
jgi:hypothetical protein